jgi:O-antigen/teichoic acid export membrane protein
LTPISHVARAKALFAGPLRNAVLLGGGTLTGQLAILAATPILSRLYSPGAFGQFGVIYSFLAFATVATVFRLDMAIMSAANDEEAEKLYLICVRACCFGSALAVGIYALLIVCRVGPFQTLPIWSTLMVYVELVFLGIGASSRFFLVRRGAFRIVGINSALQGAARAAFGVVLGLKAPTWVGLLAAEVIARLMGAVWLLRECPRVVRPVAQWRPLVWKHRKYPIVVLPSSMIDALGPATLQPLIVYLFGTTNGGLYLLSWQIAAVPAALTSAAFSDVVHSYFARATEQAEVTALFSKFVAMLSAISVCIYLPLAILAANWAGWILGSQWHDSHAVIPALCITAAASTVASPLSRIILVKNRQELKFLTDVMNLLVPSLTLASAYWAHLEFVQAVWMLVASQAVCSMIYLTLSRHISRGPVIRWKERE